MNTSRSRPRPDRDPVEIALRPKSVAVAGVSTRASGLGGLGFVNGTRRLGKVHHVYAVNPKGGELADGTPIYRSLHEIPGDVEYLISAVPAGAVLGLLEDAIAKGVAVMHLFTAGFAETGEAAGVALNAEVARRARAAGVRLIGPNCMGIYSPIGGVSWMEDAPKAVGRIGVISQSGLNANEIVGMAKERALSFSHVVSYGNAADLNESDFLDYFTEDADTDLVLAYLEGVSDGPRFLRAARRLTQRKPLVVVKGGSTAAGARAVSSHTGSLAGSEAIWDAASRQVGIVCADDLEELLDFAGTFERIPHVAGPRAGVIGGGGGFSVLAADACERHGLQLPWLAEETQRRLAEFTTLIGTSVRNPLDLSWGWGQSDFADIALTVAADRNVDLVVLRFATDARKKAEPSEVTPFEERVRRNLLTIREASATPLAVVLRPPRSVAGMRIGLRLLSRLSEDGFAVYPSMEQVSKAVSRYLGWRALRTAAEIQ